MDAKKAVKYFLLCGAAYFTALCGLILTVLAIILGEKSNIGVEPSKFLLVLALSYVWSLGSTLKRVISSKIAGLTLNAICYVGGFFTFLLLFDTDTVPALFATMLFTVVYAVVVLCENLMHKRSMTSGAGSKNPSHRKAQKPSKPNKDSKQPYENMFS